MSTEDSPSSSPKPWGVGICSKCEEKVVREKWFPWEKRYYPKRTWRCPVCRGRHGGWLYIVNDIFGGTKRIPKECLLEFFTFRVVMKVLE
ncbi:MAG: hypothetical protein ABIH46_05715 [Chloroflexota bacterium]